MLKLSTILLVFLSFLSQAKDYKILESQNVRGFYKNTKSRLVKKALLLKVEVDNKNLDDMKIAGDTAIDFYSHLDHNYRVSGVEATLNEMRAQFDKLKKVQALVAAAKFDGIKYAAFKSSFNKFVGSATNTGHLEDAIKIVETLSDGKDVPSNFGDNLTSGQQTAFKTAMIYLLSLGRNSELPFISKMKMNYLAPVPSEVKIPNELMTDWFKQTNEGLVFQALNVGYVFGGEFQNKICNGIDCSSFVSYVTESQSRLSTMVMEYTARELGAGLPLTTETELNLKKEFWETWGMRQATTEYTAHVPESTKDIRDGDIIVWRWIPAGKTAPTGHAVLVVDIKDDDSFVALECNREDDKSLDGIVLTERLLKKDASNIYVLRRRE